jgi:putative ABC transport system permease protein
VDKAEPYLKKNNMIFGGILNITFRNFRKNLLSSLIKVLGLAISISAVIVIWAYIINENKYDKNVPDSERIYRLDAQWGSMPAFLGHIINQSLYGHVLSTRLNFLTDAGIQVNNIPYNLKEMVFADSTFFKVFKFNLIEGDPREALARPFSIILSESNAKRLFGESDPLGKIIRLENQYDFTVTGIMKDRPYLHFKTGVIASLSSMEQIRYKGILKEYDGWMYPTYIMVPEDVPAEISKKEVLDLIKKSGYTEDFNLKPFNDIYYSPEIENESNTKHGNILYNKILISISIFILLLAAINFINLTIADSISRSKEVSMKKIQGASKIHLVSQFMIETIFYIISSLVIAFFILWFFNPVLYSVAGMSVQAGNLISGNNIITGTIALFIFLLLTGMYPAYHLSAYTINSSKIISAGRSAQIRIRNGLVLFQNIVAVTLICCTLIAFKQFNYMRKADLGFNKRDIVNLNINSQMEDHLDLLKERLMRYPTIENVSYSGRVMGSYWGSWCCVNIEGKVNKYFNNYVDADYLETMGIKLKEGKAFSRENQSELKTTYLINETAIKQYNLKDPIGQVILPGNGIKGTIIGIIKDFHYRGLNYAQTPLLLFYTDNHLRYVNIRIDPAKTAESLKDIKTVWNEVCPAFAFEYSFLDQTYDLQYKSEKRFENLLFVFTILAIFIAGIGLFGLSTFSTGQRTKEIGIRRVNGAREYEILKLLNKNFLKMVVMAFIVAFPLSWYAMQKWLMNFAYRTDINIWIFMLSAILALVIAFVSVSWTSWRAATRNPVEALRYE